ncbi:MAG: discoidin domain-containing protein [Planctomycetota bacterium]
MARSFLIVLCVGAMAAGGAVEEVGPAAYREAVEADWRLQDKVRTGQRVQQPRASNVSTPQDALGGVDGEITGKWGFHTLNEQDPWWHVDLGETMALDRAVLYNRCDRCGERNNRIRLLLSDDGTTWSLAYQHDGTDFGGKPDGKPLRIDLEGKAARFVRLALKGTSYFHLDEVQVYTKSDPKTNIALGKPADQSSVSQWSVAHGKPSARPVPRDVSYPFAAVLARGRQLAGHLAAQWGGAAVEDRVAELEAVARRVEGMREDASPAARRRLYLDLRWAVRRLALANPLLSFDRILFTQRALTTYSHMSDQYYGHWSRPGGGLVILEGFREGTPRLRGITPDLPEGTFLRPDLSRDGSRVVFAYCRYYPHLRGMGDKTDKPNVPDDAKFHIYEVRIDGTGLRQLTRGRYDDFDPRYLPSGRIAFLSTRRGQAFQCGRASAQATVEDPCLPDGYVRCGGGNSRPVAIYALHTMEPDGSDLRAISAFENFEWTPAVDPDGRILYARWDYVDRHNNAFMSLWATRPDGTMPALVYGNFTRVPHCTFEPRAIPGSRRLLFTASAHHSITAGSVVRLDPAVAAEGDAPLDRLTPEVCFPEMEGWPTTFYNNPWPLSEHAYLVAWSPRPLRRQGQVNDADALGLYLADAFGNLELLWRDPDLSACFPIPLRPRPEPHRLPDLVAEDEAEPAEAYVLDVYEGLDGVAPGAVKALRIVGVPAKTQPQMNHPSLGGTREDPGKVVLGTVPVEADGSARFQMPGGVNVFFQALDAKGMAIQTMRTVTYAQPGQRLGCIGCHEPRSQATPNRLAAALRRPPSPLTPGPEGSWPLRYDRLVQPVLERHCTRCHSPEGKPKACKKLNLAAGKSYEALYRYGKPSLFDVIRRPYRRGHSEPGHGAAASSVLLAHLRKGHQGVELSAADLERLVTWMDCYGQRQGHFSPAQERALERFRRRMSHLLAER